MDGEFAAGLRRGAERRLAVQLAQERGFHLYPVTY